jgi:hypothetical protein
MNVYTKRHLEYPRHFKKSPQAKAECNIWSMWTTFPHLRIGKICYIGKDIGGVVKVDFFAKNRFYRFSPPFWILNVQNSLFF